MASVAMRQVHKTFDGREVLARLDLDMADGELVCLLGPSGCGKTTLLRILAGFIRPDAGRVLIGGADVTALPPRARRIGMVFQAYSLFPNMTARDNVRFGPRVAGVARAEQTARADRLLDLVGLSEHATKYPHQLSGGQQQRVALARALAVQPQVLLLDEPLSALDAKVRAQLRDEIRRIQRETAITTVLVTHDQEEALSMGDRVAVMNAGRLLQVASPANIYRDPADGFVARFIGTAAVLAGVAESGCVRVAGIAMPARGADAFPPGHPVDLFIRPEHVRLEPADGPATARGVAGVVRDYVFYGPTTRVRVDVPGANGGAPNVIWADVASEAAAAFGPETRVLAHWIDTAPRVFPRS